MDVTTLVTAGASIAAVITAIAGYVRGRSERAKLGAEHDELVTRTAISLIEPLRRRLDEQAARITELEAQVVELRRENAELHEGIQILCTQIAALGQEPRWRPRARG